MAKVIFAKHTLSDCLDSTFTASVFSVLRFPLFFFLFFSRFSRRQISLFTHCSRTIHALFTGPTATLFRKKYIKNGSHGTIHAFKNYFAIVFSVFSFQQNKRYPITFLLLLGSIALFDTILSSTILFQLTFTFIYNTFSKKFSILTK